MAEEHLEQLIQFTRQRDHDAVRGLLTEIPRDEKGPIFEKYLEHLYQGNGFHTAHVGGRGDKGGDILLCDPDSPNNVLWVIQAKNWAKPIPYKEVKSELQMFEEKGSDKYGCTQFKLVSVSGFVDDAKKLSEFNLKFSEWPDICDLIDQYEVDGRKKPAIELYAYQQLAYEAVKDLWINSRYAAVIQATGTGKSYIIAKIMADPEFLDEPKIIIAPSHHILKQQKKRIPWVSRSAKYVTYSKLSKMTQSDFAELKPKLIVLDEFHRGGADQWGAAVRLLIDTANEAYILGTSATPIRHLDDSRDMTDELFDGKEAANLSLGTAIAKRILPNANYIAALYSIDIEMSKLKGRVEATKMSADRKSGYLEELKGAASQFNNTGGIPRILKKYLHQKVRKVIIFCKDKEHLTEMEVEVEGWFFKAGYKNRRRYRFISGDPDRAGDLKEFENAKSANTLHLLFAVDRLNEGLHIPGVKAVVLLRSTESPTVFFQQIGRCLDVNQKTPPIIFDFVNNFASIQTSNFHSELRECAIRETKKRKKLGLPEYAPKIHIVDETKDIVDLFNQIGERLSGVPWERGYAHLLAFIDRKRHCLVPKNHREPSLDEEGEFFLLGSWVRSQRQSWKSLSDEKKKLLLDVGFERKPREAHFLEGCEALRAYKEREHDFIVPIGHIEQGFALSRWTSNLITSWDSLSKDRQKMLTDLGWVAKPNLELKWEEGYLHFKEFVRRENHARVIMGHEEPHLCKPGKLFPLGGWLSRQRTNWDQLDKKGHPILDDKKKALMLELGFAPSVTEALWQEGYAHLLAYVDRVGHALVPSGHKEPSLTERGKFFNLGGWVNRQRKRWNPSPESKIKPLDKEKRELLIEVGFEPSARKKDIEIAWQTWIGHFASYLKQGGKLPVPQKNKHNGVFLGRWYARMRKNYENYPEKRKRELAALGVNEKPP